MAVVLQRIRGFRDVPSTATVEIERVMDAARVNAVINHPDVHPTLSYGLGYLDATKLVDNPANVFLMGEHGGGAFIATASDEYDAHSFFLPAGRGKWALAAARAILSRMFDTYGARRLHGKTPVEHRVARAFNRMVGFQSKGGDLAILVPGGAAQPVELFEMVA